MSLLQHTKPVSLILLGCALGLGMLLVLGITDEQARTTYDKHYCEMVKKGYWPDYRRQYADDCLPKTSSRR